MFFSHFRFLKHSEFPGMKMLLLIISYISVLPVWSQPPYSVVINEIMADPSPAVGLPDHEWIELFNAGDTDVSLFNWRLGDGNSLSGPFPQLTLAPKQYLIICAASARPAMELYGKVITIPSFPSLDNAGEVLYLRTADGRTMHAVRYSDRWYDNTLKKEGGWSLEMIDAKNPCHGMNNWKASVHATGGTPGAINSVAGSNIDTDPPKPLRTYSYNDHNIAVVFDEPLDSLNATSILHYKIGQGIDIIKASCPAPLFDEVILETAQALDSQLIYSIEIDAVRDCSQNEMKATRILKAGLFSPPLTGKAVVSEILFNPRSGGNDFVEIFNAGGRTVDAGQLYLAGRNTNGQLSAAFRLTSSRFALYPGDYIVVTTDAASLSRHYFVKDPSRVLEISSMPSFPDDKGTVVLMDFQGTMLDEVSYDQRWHHQLISDPEGVSLERIDPLGPSNIAGNWHSAASTAGYGTPGYINSQFRPGMITEDMFSISPRIFSPDNDGMDDIARIMYKTGSPGFIANVFIFDGSGHQVSHLVRNELLAAEGYWNWNGLNDQQQILPIGIYIIQMEIFDLKGTVQRSRKTIVLAKKLE
ncbi:MAG: hypothetical protein DI535_22210 [Citrobacter freundii]|nr:MAG: hypothetical protein DI535_22210 [Citrobacter freundii]